MFCSPGLAGAFLLLLLEKLVILQIGHFVKKEGDEYGVS